MASHEKMAPEKKRKRPRPLPPEVNSRNLATEKRKREEMNENFMEMARLVPSLHGEERLTKVLIVTRTIEYLQNQQETRSIAEMEMQQLREENQRLASELESIRAHFTGHADATAPVIGSTDAAASQFMPSHLATVPTGYGVDISNDSAQLGFKDPLETSCHFTEMNDLPLSCPDLPYLSDMPESMPLHLQNSALGPHIPFDSIMGYANSNTQANIPHL